jgi:hypothetical protein
MPESLERTPVLHDAAEKLRKIAAELDDPKDREVLERAAREIDRRAERTPIPRPGSPA